MRLLLILFSLATLHATDYYVSATGSDSNPGTSTGSPWQTITKVNAGTYNPGDTINFHGGDSFSGTITAALAGSSGNLVTVQSYGTGQATISAGNSSGFNLTNPEYLVIQNLIITGTGWTGLGINAVVVNSGNGIGIFSTNTTAQMGSLAITGNTITSFYQGIWIDAGKTSAISTTKAWDGVTISGNTISNNLAGGLLIQGYHALAGGPTNQFTNVSITHNTLQNIPGDPNAGSGGVHGSINTEAWGINVANASTVDISYNLDTDIGGSGAANIPGGLTFGGSGAIQAANGSNITMTYNETARTRCSASADGGALDFDQDVTTGEAAHNLSYDNVGPAVQFGSFGGFTTSGILVHHNVSINDSRGTTNTFNDAFSEQGSFRLWGSTDNSQLYNNACYVDWVGTLGSPSCVSFENSNTHVTIANNIFKTTQGIPMIRANQALDPTHLPATLTVDGNLYDSSGGSLIISNDNGSTYTNITTLSAWRGLGYETLSSVNYGSTGVAGLRGLIGFTPPFPNGYIGNGLNPNAITAFDLGPSSAAIELGINPSLVSITLPSGDFHGNAPSRSGGTVWDSGAATYLVLPSVTTTGKASISGMAGIQ